VESEGRPRGLLNTTQAAVKATGDGSGRKTARADRKRQTPMRERGTQESPVTNGELCRALLFKPTASKGPPPAALRNVLLRFLGPILGLANGYKFLLPSLRADYLPLAFFREQNRS
jgi:hypothetical protein